MFDTIYQSVAVECPQKIDVVTRHDTTLRKSPRRGPPRHEKVYTVPPESEWTAHSRRMSGKMLARNISDVDLCVLHEKPNTSARHSQMKWPMS